MQVPDCPAGHIELNDLESAIDAANSDPDHDTIRIGPGTFDEDGLSDTGQPVTITGAGAGATVLEGTGSYVLTLHDPNSVVRDLTVRITVADNNGLNLDEASAQRVSVVHAPGVVPFHGVRMDDASFSDGFVGMPDATGTGRGAILATGGSTVTSSTLIGDTALRMDGLNGVARRLRLVGGIAFLTAAGTQRLSQIIALPHPDLPADEPFNAIRAVGTASQPTARIEVTHLTAVGKGAGIAGPDSALVAQSTAVAGQIAARNAVLRGMDYNVFRTSSGANADVSAAYSSFDDEKRFGDDAAGGLSTGPGHIDSEAPARFVNPAAGDYRLRHDSPLLEQGDPASLSFAETIAGDVDGKSRARDSDGDGIVRRDTGAHEYQRLAPTAAFTHNSPVFLGEPVRFKGGTSTDPDGDALTYSWLFGDGTTGAGTPRNHVYALPGQFTARLTVTDPTGLSNQTTRAVQVDLRKGRCANRRAGGPGADTIEGFEVGDELAGRGGKDRLRGNAGADCLYGGKGADELAGGKGNDDLRAGGGKNVLEGGKGNDRLFAVNGKKDVVACGPGPKDRARVDTSDDVSGCEIVDRK